LTKTDTIYKILKIEKAFKRGENKIFSETEEGYSIWESLLKKFLLQFKFFYEYLPSHANGFLKEAKLAGFKNIDDSEIIIPEDGSDPFNEKRDAHLQLFFATGEPVSAYVFDDGSNGDLHNSGIEIGNLFNFVDPLEFAPLIFPTDANFYEESVNKTFLTNPEFDKKPGFPIYHPFHKGVFTSEYFNKILKLPQALLNINFNLELKNYPEKNSALTTAVKMLNFSLKFLYHVCLMESGYIDLFGSSRRHAEMINYLEKTWRFGNGKKTKGINSFHLFILAFLIRATHQCGYGICASIYRLKNGYLSYNPGHGTWQIGNDKQKLPFKIFLQECIKILIEKWCEEISLSENNNYRTQLKENIECAVKLGEIFGLGYEVNPKISKNYFENKPVDFRPSIAQGEKFNGINFTAKIYLESPLWRYYYLYSRKMWKKSKITREVFSGKGRHWKINKNHPRSRLLNILFEYEQKFKSDLLIIKDQALEENLGKIIDLAKLDKNGKLKEKFDQTYRKYFQAKNKLKEERKILLKSLSFKRQNILQL
jgi:hypothetical protein